MHDSAEKDCARRMAATAPGLAWRGGASEKVHAAGREKASREAPGCDAALIHGYGMEPAPCNSRRFALGTALLLLVGLLSAFAAMCWQQRANQALVGQRLQASGQRAAEAVSARLRVHEQALLATRGALFGALDDPEGLTRAQFQRHVAAMQWGQHPAGMDSLSIVRRIAPAQEAAFMASMRRDGLAVQAHPLDPDPAELVVQYTEPLHDGAAPPQPQWTSDAASRDAALAALRSGLPRITPPVAPDQGLAMLMPVYRSATPPEPAQRERQAHGWISATLAVQPLLQVLDDEDASLAIAVTDATASAGPLRLFTSPRWQDAARSSVHRETVTLFGPVWYVDVQALPPFVERLGTREPAALGVAVLLVALLLALMVHVGGRALRHRCTALRQRAGGAGVEDGAFDAVVIQSLHGAILSWNPGAERLLGWRAAEALGRDLVEMAIAPEQRDQALAAIGRVRAGDDVPSLQTLCLDRQSRAVAVVLSMSPLFAEDASHVVGAVTTMRAVQAPRAQQEPAGTPAATLKQALRQRLSQLQQLAAREQAILASVGSAVVAADLQGRIVLFNAAGEVAFARPAARALGHPVLGLFDPEELHDRAQDLPAEMVRALMPHASASTPAHEGKPRRQWSFARADGTRFTGQLEACVLCDEAGGVGGFLLVITDLTERRAMQEALRQRTDDAQAASRAKNAFLSAMSHEFRTPLNAVVGFSQLLQGMDLPQKALEFAGHIARGGDQLVSLTDKVLDFARIEAGDVELRHAPFELKALLHAVQEGGRAAALAKGLALDVQCSPELPRTLCGDAQRLKQALRELLANAVKFSASGGVKMLVDPAGREPGRVVLRIDVVDSGPGIAPEVQSRLFEPFTQGDSSDTRRNGGMGLGLSMVRRLVTLMGGQVELASTSAQGSAFRVRLALGTVGRDN